MRALKGQVTRGFRGHSTPEKFEILVLQDAISSFLRAQLLSKMLTKLIVIFTVILFAWLLVQGFDFILHFVRFLKFFGISVFIMYTLICVLV